MLMYWLKSQRKITKFIRLYLSRNISSENKYVEKLSKRTVLKLSGADTANYLQSMITNDIKKIEELPSMYSLLLNTHGKVLYDTILFKLSANEYLVEYDASAVEYLHRHLLMYRLRKDVKIDPHANIKAWVLYSLCKDADMWNSSDVGTLLSELTKIDGVVSAVKDPRTNYLGVRILTTEQTNLPKLLKEKFNVDEGKNYTDLRYQLGIGEGVADHPPGNCLPLETNVDYLNGVSFTKGCYIGQELTARSHFILHVKKRLLPVTLPKESSYPIFPPECPILNEKQEKMGRLRSHYGQYGLAVLKSEESFKVQHLLLKGFDFQLKCMKPPWWPANDNST